MKRRVQRQHMRGAVAVADHVHAAVVLHNLSGPGKGDAKRGGEVDAVDDVVGDDRDFTTEVFSEQPLDDGLHPGEDLRQLLAAGIAVRRRVAHEATISLGLGLLDLDPRTAFPQADVALGQFGNLVDGQAMRGGDWFGRLARAEQGGAIHGPQLASTEQLGGGGGLRQPGVG